MSQTNMPLQATPPITIRSIEDQCPALEWKVGELLGRTAREVRALGFDIPASVPQEYVLREDTGIEVDISTQGRRTGLAWVKK